jgi:hypothetical protein
LSPWSCRRRSGPPPWPGCRRAHARARTHTCNHARTHVPVLRCATMRALAWRGQGRAYGSFSRLTLSALRPATGRGFAAEGNLSSPEARAPTRSRSCAPALAHARANPVVASHTSSEIEAPSSRPPRRSTSPRCRERPSAWVLERQAKSVHVFVHTHVRRRTPRRATTELAAVAKPPTCLCAQVRTWTPPLAGQCSLTHARAKASPFCGQTSCELRPSPPTFSSSPGKPRS